MTSRPAAIVFDFDGVILQSVNIKTQAFEKLFAAESPDAVKKIIAHHLANGGISRFEKFRHAYDVILKRPLTGEEEVALGRRFNALVEEAVSTCPWVPGAREFLEARHKDFPLFVASGTPQEELARIVERRGLKAFFRAVYGTPTTKDMILRSIAAGLRCEGRDLLMVGDAMTDHDAARATGAAFVGVETPGAPNCFPKGVKVLPDLTGLGALVETGI